ncbi:MAG TPA: cysteine desulfurase family protein, partial [Victivallales bacterium]|nr:cysteine desulfurase family protein [Victivallales bacterium]
MKPIYLDHNATTPCSKEAFDAMLPFLSDKFGNPSSAHSAGRDANFAIERTREQVASLINASPEEIVFTSGGTEANNQAIIRGIESSGKNEILSSEIEHSAVLSVCKNLSNRGIRTKYLPNDKDCIVDASSIAKFASSDTGLISVMTANNETGAIQPIADIAKFAREAKILIHSDAVQAAGKIKLDVRELGVDMLSISSHKFYGPKGAGALFIRKGLKISALIFGGSQERRLRAGTENVPALVGFGKACELARKELTDRMSKCERLRQLLLALIQKKIDGIRVNTDLKNSVCSTLNIGFRDVASEALLT